MADVWSKWKFYWHEQGDHVTTKNTEYKITILQMLNNNYGNELLPWQASTPSPGQEEAALCPF